MPLTWAAVAGPTAFRLSSTSSDGVDWLATESGAAIKPTLKVTCT